MKIYNKKSFLFGIFSTALGLLNTVTSIATGFDVKSVILIVLLLFFGLTSIIRSLSHRLSKEDKQEDLDERNRLISLKSKSKSFNITQLITFLLLIIFLVTGAIKENNTFIGIGVGLTFAYTISMFAEIFTYMYYEKHL